MFVTTQAGTVLEIDLEENKVLSKWDSKENRNILGIQRIDNILYVCTQSKLYKLELPSYKKLKRKRFRDNSFHHIMIRDGFIYLTSTAKNAIIRVNMKFRKKKIFYIDPPIKDEPVIWKKNYNHLNNICYYKGKYYIDLNWLTTTQFSDSGVAVLNEDFEEIDRFKFGWQTHCFCWIEDKKHALCATTNKEEAQHPLKSGLMVEGDLVFDHGLDYYSKYFLKDENHYYIFAGETGKREDRGKHDGIVFILDNDYNLVKKHEFPKTGGFSGATF